MALKRRCTSRKKRLSVFPAAGPPPSDLHKNLNGFNLKTDLASKNYHLIGFIPTVDVIVGQQNAGLRK